jgi:hypothetical protein
MNLIFLIVFLSVAIAALIMIGVIEIIKIEKKNSELKRICDNLEISHTNSSKPIVYVRAKSKEEMRILLKSGRIPKHCIGDCVDYPICRTISLDLRKVLFTIGRTF